VSSVFFFFFISPPCWRSS